VQMFLAAQDFVTRIPLETMMRRTAHRAIAEAYNVPCGDAIVLMKNRYDKGELDLKIIWPLESFDTTHPSDAGYALYAEAAWEAYSKAVSDKVVCRVPEKMLNADTYMHVARVKLSTLAPLPQGWRTTVPSGDYCAFDFLMTRWLDDVTAGSNFKFEGRDKIKASSPALPLELKFLGSSVLFFGASAPHSGKCKVTIDGVEKIIDTRQLGPNNTGRMWCVVAEMLDATKEHDLTIAPIFDGDTPSQVQVESICVAGGKAKLWVNAHNTSTK
jgi:hypothetical protein